MSGLEAYMKALVTQAKRFPRCVALGILGAAAALPVPQANAQTYSSYATGHITRVSFIPSGVMIMLDVACLRTASACPMGG